MAMHLLMSIPPLLVAMIFGLGMLSYWWVVGFGVLMACIQSLSDPARQATLSRVARMDIQRAVTVMTVCTSLVGLTGPIRRRPVRNPRIGHRVDDSVAAVPVRYGRCGAPTQPAHDG